MGEWSFLLIILGGLLGAAFLAAAIWLATPARPQPEALEALVPNARLAVQLKPWIALLPAQARQTGLILYPGARVDPHIYARTARAIADRGFTILTIPMPLNLALLAPNSAVGAMRDFPAIRQWVLAGHSLGGVAAAHFVRKHPERAAGLVLWAAIPAITDDLSGATFPATSIYATEDRLVPPKAIVRARRRLPQHTHYVEIVGGNHAQFGRYPRQPGSHPAAISPDEQQDLVVQATLAVLAEVDGARP
jgi:hypothetical protein